MSEQPGILILATTYPPVGKPAGAAAIRTRALATGLRAAGHPVTVVCARAPGNEPRVDEGVRVVPTPWVDVEAHARRVGLDFRELSKPRFYARSPRPGVLREAVVRLTVPDRYVIWVPGAIATAWREGRRHRIVISTGPVSAHLVAWAVRRARPWIADCNDLWALNPHRTNGRIRDAVDVFLERSTLAQASRLTTVNDAMRDELERRFGKPVSTLYSGYDPRDFAAPSVSSRPANGRPLSLLFAGTLYAGLELTPLYRALAAGKREGWLSPRRLRLSFVGRLTDRAALEAQPLDVAEFVTTDEPIPRHELLERLADADALLLPVYANDPTALPMRFFEYVGAGRPIVALGARDRLAARLVDRHRLGVVLSDGVEMKAWLRDVVDGRAALSAPDPGARAQFTWTAGLRVLSSLVDELAAGGPAGQLAPSMP